jgi:hypothetical protein
MFPESKLYLGLKARNEKSLGHACTEAFVKTRFLLD